MRANPAIVCLAAVAVVAEQLIVALWPAKAAKRQPHTITIANCFSVQIPMSVDMVKSQELAVGLAAACALSTIGLNHLHARSSTSRLGVDASPLMVLVVPLFGPSACLLKILKGLLGSPFSLPFSEDLRVGLPASLPSFLLKNFPLLVSKAKPFALFLDNFRSALIARLFAARFARAGHAKPTLRCASKKLRGRGEFLAASTAALHVFHA